MLIQIVGGEVKKGKKKKKKKQAELRRQDGQRVKLHEQASRTRFFGVPESTRRRFY